MRTLLLSIAVGSCAIAHAQNWALLNPTYKYNYSNDGSDTISNQIFVTHIDTLGVDSFRYELNRIGVVCDTCPTPNFECGSFSDGTIFRNDGEQFTGGVAITASGSTWLIKGNDTLMIPVNVALGSIWTGPGGVIGMVTAISEASAFGTLDSLRTIAYSTGDTLTMARDHGLLSWSNGILDHLLIGINGSEEGAQFPNMLDMFDYWPGDVLEYHGEGGSTDGLCWYGRHWISKFTILSREDAPGRSDYQVRQVTSTYSWGQPVFGSWPCPGDFFSWVDTLNLGVVHDHWTPENFLGNRWVAKLWPGALDTAIFTDLYTPYGMVLKAEIDQDGHYTIGGRSLDAWGQSHLLCTTLTDSTLFGSPALDDMDRTYVSRIGYTGSDYLAFEHSGSEHLFASIIRGMQTGDISSDDFILSAGEQDGEEGLRVYPVPADQEIFIASAVPTESWTIMDLGGRPAMIGLGSLSSNSIDVSVLPTGPYVMELVTANGVMRTRLIIAR